jgi:hypothetical protein
MFYYNITKHTSCCVWHTISPTRSILVSIYNSKVVPCSIDVSPVPLSYTNPSLMFRRHFFVKTPQNRCGNPVYETPKLGERPYKHVPKLDFQLSIHRKISPINPTTKYLYTCIVTKENIIN